MPSPEEQQPSRPSAKAGRGQTPRDFFEGVFDVVVEELDRNPAFAERLAARLEDVLRIELRKARRATADAPDALMEADLKQLRQELGEAELREKLAGFKNAELAAFIRARKLADGAISKRPKNSLINIVMRAAR